MGSSESSLQADFQKDGFYILEEPALDADLVNRARAGMDLLREGVYDTGTPHGGGKWKPGDDPNSLCKMEIPQLGNLAIRELITSTEIGRLAAAATGAAMIQVWWVQLLYKPPTPDDEQAPNRVGWHQDWNYWKPSWDDGSELLTAWVALCDVEVDSGPMRFVRGSHGWGHVEGSDFYSQESGQGGIEPPQGSEWEEVPAPMPGGALSLHDKLTLHGSDINRSAQPRRSLAIHLRTEKSQPRGNPKEGTCRYMEEEEICPVIYGDPSL
jgi:hypothetical protein